MPAAKKVLEVNPRHPIIRNLSGMMIANADNPLINSAIRQLYEGALLLEGDLSSTTGLSSG